MPKRHKNTHHTGFTLAEVLITLVIIGVIAAVTVPAIIQQTQKQEYVAGLKKAYSTLQNSLYKIADNNGYPHGDYSFLNNVDFIDEFVKVANVVKKCDSTADCFPSKIGGSNTVYKHLSGNNTSASDGKSVITNDGQMYTVVMNPNVVHGLSSEDEANALGRIIVDVNGWKKPNKYGLDTFFFYVIEGKGIVPAGAVSTDDCNKNGYGSTCTAKVLREGKIDY